MQSNSFLQSRQFAVVSLLIANVVTAVFFIFGDASIAQVLWAYWLQSVIIGCFAVLRMLKLPMPALTGTPDDHKVVATLNSREITAHMLSTSRYGSLIRLFCAGFFILHYGAFHIGYAFFLFSFSIGEMPLTIGSTYAGNVNLGAVSAGAVLMAGLAFAMHHAVSYFVDRADPAKHFTFDLMFKPYARIIPMHLIIIIGPVVALYLGNNSVFVVFIIIKTVADLVLSSKTSSKDLGKFRFSTH